MNPTIAVVRAIGTEFVRRSLWPLTLIGGSVVLVLVGLGGWLTTLNVWWWLLETVFLMLAIAYLIITVAVWTIIKLVRPDMTKSQRTAVGNYVDKLQRVADNVQTPQPVLLFRVVRDVVRPRQDGFIETVSRDSKGLAPDFVSLIRKFQ